jgi:hypothetical protein
MKVVRIFFLCTFNYKPISVYRNLNVSKMVHFLQVTRPSPTCISLLFHECYRRALLTHRYMTDVNLVDLNLRFLLPSLFRVNEMKNVKVLPAN